MEPVETEPVETEPVQTEPSEDKSSTTAKQDSDEAAAQDEAFMVSLLPKQWDQTMSEKRLRDRIGSGTLRKRKGWWFAFVDYRGEEKRVAQGAEAGNEDDVKPDEKRARRMRAVEELDGQRLDGHNLRVMCRWAHSFEARFT